MNHQAFHIIPYRIIASICLLCTHVSALFCTYDSDCRFDQICWLRRHTCWREPIVYGDPCNLDEDCVFGVGLICESMSSTCRCEKGSEFVDGRCFEPWRSKDTIILIAATFAPIALTVCLTILIVHCVKRRRIQRRDGEMSESTSSFVNRATTAIAAESGAGTSRRQRPVTYDPDQDKPPDYDDPPSYNTAVEKWDVSSIPVIRSLPENGIHLCVSVRQKEE